MWCVPLPTVAAYTAALVLTLLLARYLTPARWWRHANARAFLTVAGGTWIFASLLGATIPWLAPPATSTCFSSAPATGGLALPMLSSTGAAEPSHAWPATRGIVDQPPVAEVPLRVRAPAAGSRYTVAQALNLRAAPGVSARRIGTVPAHAALVATGVYAGEWWEVRHRTGTVNVTGWASSLWLRRIDELAPGP